MTTFLFRRIAAFVILAATLMFLSCGGGPELTRIVIVPQNITVAGTPTVVYTAIGHYKQTTVTKDITSEVVWQTVTPSIVSFSDSTHPNYLLPTGTGCGSNLGVTAAVYKNRSNPTSGEAVVGTATVNVQCGTSSGTDFGLSSNPTSVTISAGSTATYTINVIENSGNPTVALRVASGLPAGATASFNPSSVTAVGASTLTITTVAGTAAGTYHPRITGSDTSGSLTLGMTMNIN